VSVLSFWLSIVCSLVLFGSVCSSGLLVPCLLWFLLNSVWCSCGHRMVVVIRSFGSLFGDCGSLGIRQGRLGIWWGSFKVENVFDIGLSVFLGLSFNDNRWGSVYRVVFAVLV
jgi:hypothetical protein